MGAGRPQVGAARDGGVVARAGSRGPIVEVLGLVKPWPIRLEPTTWPLDRDQRAIGLVVEEHLRQRRS